MKRYIYYTKEPISIISTSVAAEKWRSEKRMLLGRTWCSLALKTGLSRPWCSFRIFFLLRCRRSKSPEILLRVGKVERLGRAPSFYVWIFQSSSCSVFPSRRFAISTGQSKRYRRTFNSLVPGVFVICECVAASHPPPPPFAQKKRIAFTIFIRM